MYPLLETVRFENGMFDAELIPYHVARMERSVENWLDKPLSYNPLRIFHDLEKQNKKRNGLYKVRLLYDEKGFVAEFLSYRLPAVQTLLPVFDDSIDYSYKFSQREALNSLKAKKKSADDVLIIKNGMVTDTTFTNVLFFDGKKWVTPKTPLLAGTKRACLLNQKRIYLSDIPFESLYKYQKVRLVNAMIKFHDKLDVRVLQP